MSQNEDIPAGERFLMVEEDSRLLLLPSIPPKFYSDVKYVLSRYKNMSLTDCI